MGVLPASHAFSLWQPGYKTYFYLQVILLMMASKTISIKIDPEMEEYIKSKSSDLRIASTCEGPIIFSIKTSPPKATDHVISVGARKVYISAVQAPHIKSIDERMLPRCALEKRKC
jgi:hypothetical protein